MRGQRHAPAAFYPWERLGTHCTGGWLGPRVCLDKCGKSRSPPGFDLRTVQPLASRFTDYATLYTDYVTRYTDYATRYTDWATCNTDWATCYTDYATRYTDYTTRPAKWQWLVIYFGDFLQTSESCNGARWGWAFSIKVPAYCIFYLRYPLSDWVSGGEVIRSVQKLYSNIIGVKTLGERPHHWMHMHRASNEGLG